VAAWWLKMVVAAANSIDRGRRMGYYVGGRGGGKTEA